MCAVHPPSLSTQTSLLCALARVVEKCAVNNILCSYFRQQYIVCSYFRQQFIVCSYEQFLCALKVRRQQYTQSYVSNCFLCALSTSRGYCIRTFKQNISTLILQFKRSLYFCSLSFDSTYVHWGNALRVYEVTYLYISGIVTIPKQSECNVNSYNKIQ